MQRRHLWHQLHWTAHLRRSRIGHLSQTLRTFIPLASAALIGQLPPITFSCWLVAGIARAPDQRNCLAVARELSLQSCRRDQTAVSRTGKRWCASPQNCSISTTYWQILVLTHCYPIGIAARFKIFTDGKHWLLLPRLLLPRLLLLRLLLPRLRLPRLLLPRLLLPRLLLPGLQQYNLTDKAFCDILFLKNLHLTLCIEGFPAYSTTILQHGHWLGYCYVGTMWRSVMSYKAPHCLY